MQTSVLCAEKLIVRSPMRQTSSSLPGPAASRAIAAAVRARSAGATTSTSGVPSTAAPYAGLASAMRPSKPTVPSRSADNERRRASWAADGSIVGMPSIRGRGRERCSIFPDAEDASAFLDRSCRFGRIRGKLGVPATPLRSTMPDVRRVVIVVFEGLQALDALGPAEVFSQATRIEAPGYAVELVGTSPVTTTSGFSVGPVGAFADCTGPLDTLMVAGGVGIGEAEHDEELIAWVRAAAGRA